MVIKREKRVGKQSAKYSLKINKQVEKRSDNESSDDQKEHDNSSEGESLDISDIDDEPQLEVNSSEPTKKKKKAHHDNNDFASIMGQILSQSTGEKETEKPAVLSKAKDIEKKIESEKLDYKARKALAAEKKSKIDKDHVLPDYKTMDYEKKLRKVATSGVVKLFNAIRIQRKAMDVDHLDLKNEEKVEVAKMSKASFLDMLKAGTTASKP